MGHEFRDERDNPIILGTLRIGYCLVSFEE